MTIKAVKENKGANQAEQVILSKNLKLRVVCS